MAMTVCDGGVKVRAGVELSSDVVCHLRGGDRVVALASATDSKGNLRARVAVLPVVLVLREDDGPGGGGQKLLAGWTTLLGMSRLPSSLPTPPPRPSLSVFNFTGIITVFREGGRGET